MKKRSITIKGHATSISMEDEFWDALKSIAGSRGSSVNQLIEQVDAGHQGTLSSAIRVFILKDLQSR